MAASGTDPIASRAAVRLLDVPGEPWPGGLAGRLPPNELPREITSFIGRDQQIADLARELSGTRLLTLIGPGGVGKTRLALELAEHQQADFADGACFVSLAGIAEPTMVPQAVVGALGLRAEGDRPVLDTLLSRLQVRTLLLVLDNCEHLLAGCGPFADALLRACPGLRILATSREPLGVAGETVWAVQPMAIPDERQAVSVDALLACEAARLFIERASAAQAGFALRPDNASAIAEICRRLDGMPLAIELAAVRVRGLTVDQIATRLGDAFRLLAGGPRAAPPRHQTLRAAVDWSYDLLSQAERALFNRLSVFVGGWTLEAAEIVCAGEAVQRDEVVHLLTRLVDRSLVVAEERSGAMRYRLLETLRQYGAERLSHTGEAMQLRDRHRDWCVALAELGERDIWRADQLACIQRLEREHDNLRAALGWTLTGAGDPEPGLRIAAAMVRFWDVHGDLREGTRWLTDLLSLSSVPRETPGWAKALTARGYLAVIRGDLAEAIADLNAAIVFWRRLADSRGLAVALFFRGLAVAWTGADLAGAQPIFEESLLLARQRGPRWTAYFCVYCLGETARVVGDLDRAEALLGESLSLTQAERERWGAFHALYSLAFLTLKRGDRRRAYDLAQQSLTLSLELGDTRGSTYALEALGCIAAVEGQARRAARVFGAAQALREPLGGFLSAILRADRDEAVAILRADLGEAGFGAAFAAGRGLTLDQAVAVARTPDATGTTTTGLTSRERDIARLVAQGLSNRDIANALVVSERTTESHLSHIFTKLGLRSRTQLATWAIEHGVLASSTNPPRGGCP
jgi:predicted ATPase/DNA-binding CsgD family transcriptional regulator